MQEQEKSLQEVAVENNFNVDAVYQYIQQQLAKQGVTKDSDDFDKRIYKRLSLAFHTDLHLPEHQKAAQEAFNNVQENYDPDTKQADVMAGLFSAKKPAAPKANEEDPLITKLKTVITNKNKYLYRAESGAEANAEKELRHYLYQSRQIETETGFGGKELHFKMARDYLERGLRYESQAEKYLNLLQARILNGVSLSSSAAYKYEEVSELYQKIYRSAHDQKIEHHPDPDGKNRHDYASR